MNVGLQFIQARVDTQGGLESEESSGWGASDSSGNPLRQRPSQRTGRGDAKIEAYSAVRSRRQKNVLQNLKNIFL